MRDTMIFQIVKALCKEILSLEKTMKTVLSTKAEFHAQVMVIATKMEPYSASQDMLKMVGSA